MDEQSLDKQTAPAQLTSVMIANALDSPAAHTSFGKLPLAAEKSAPMYTFGTGTREEPLIANLPEPGSIVDESFARFPESITTTIHG